ncbi:PREDICTED: aurora kinase B-like [Nicrophorus vespilloides]|uniref:Aurora kinase B-like n=1 Tax=Nicrophorus vespilloides TaxID=110193 RepID=A0ABM1MCI3_NICVS|nr:PREDICTED: aurora kinase B-like [Nicrophorus vespilloides]
MVDCNIDVAVKKYVEDLQVPSHYLQATEKMICCCRYKWSLDDFELGLKLGQGKFGRVFSGREKRTGYVVAIKTLMKVELVREGAEALVIREVEIQSHLKHPNILQLLTWFHDDFRVYLVLEYAGQGELYKSLKESPGGYFSDHLAAKYMYQVTDALNYCHTNHVLHRDIKPENIMLTTDGNIKLADFGWSAHSPSMKRDTLCGTLDYTPPEMLEGRMYGIGVDQWCLGEDSLVSDQSCFFICINFRYFVLRVRDWISTLRE